MSIRSMVIDLAHVTGHRLSEKQLELYIADLVELNLTDAELEIVSRQVRHELDRFPSLAQLWSIANSITRTKNDTEPNWATWQDDQGRTWAQKFPGRRATVPTNEDLEQWKREAVPASEGRKIFMEAYLKAGGKPEAMMDVKDREGFESIGSICNRVLPDLNKPTPKPHEPEIDLLDDLEVEP